MTQLGDLAQEMTRLLLDLEWSGMDGDMYGGYGSCCPCCQGSQPHVVAVPARRIDAFTRVEAHEVIEGGHAPDCRLVAVLKKAGVL